MDKGQPESLAKIIDDGRCQKYTSDTVAHFIENAGYIHKSKALEMVEVCKTCSGSGICFQEFHLDNICPTCKGRGIVLK